VLELSPFYYEISSTDDTLSHWKYVRAILITLRIRFNLLR
jgi:hypothetical protein